MNRSGSTVCSCSSSNCKSLLSCLNFSARFTAAAYSSGSSCLLLSSSICAFRCSRCFCTRMHSCCSEFRDAIRYGANHTGQHGQFVSAPHHCLSMRTCKSRFLIFYLRSCLSCKSPQEVSDADLLLHHVGPASAWFTNSWGQVTFVGQLPERVHAIHMG